jgi:hypothetical protein
LFDREFEADGGQAIVDGDIRTPPIANALDEVTDFAGKPMEVSRVERIKW